MHTHAAVIAFSRVFRSPTARAAAAVERASAEWTWKACNGNAFVLPRRDDSEREKWKYELAARGCAYPLRACVTIAGVRRLDERIARRGSTGPFIMSKLELTHWCWVSFFSSLRPRNPSIQIFLASWKYSIARRKNAGYTLNIDINHFDKNHTCVRDESQISCTFTHWLTIRSQSSSINRSLPNFNKIHQEFGLAGNILYPMCLLISKPALEEKVTWWWKIYIYIFLYI